jgi:uncharacterized protein (DUF302 family)
MLIAQSAVDYAQTVDRLIAAITERGLTVFARVDHAAGARAVDLELADEEVIIFGQARGGTPLMQADPRIGLDLPLRVLVWSQDGAAHVGYRDPREWAHEYDVAAQAGVLDTMTGLLAALVEAATAAP